MKWMKALCVIMVLLTPSVSFGQTWRGYQIRQPAPNCNLAQMSSDNFIGDGKVGTVYARRYQLHLISIGTSVAASYAIKKIFKMGPVKSAAIGGVATGILPHVRSVLIQRRYPINPGDLAADATMRMVPFIMTVGHHQHTKTAHAMSALTVVASYFAVACFASP